MREAGFYIFRGYAKLKPLTFSTTTFGLHFFRHLTSNAWNKLPETPRKAYARHLLKKNNQSIIVFVFFIIIIIFI